MKIKAIADHIIGLEGDFGDFTSEAGIVVKSTIGSAEGITPRWFQIHSIGPRAQAGLQEGQWVLVDYGRWSESVEHDKIKYWRLDPEAMSIVSDTKPSETFYFNNDTVSAPKKELL